MDAEKGFLQKLLEIVQVIIMQETSIQRYF